MSNCVGRATDLQTYLEKILRCFACFTMKTEVFGPLSSQRRLWTKWSKGNKNKQNGATKIKSQSGTEGQNRRKSRTEEQLQRKSINLSSSRIAPSWQSCTKQNQQKSLKEERGGTLFQGRPICKTMSFTWSKFGPLLPLMIISFCAQKHLLHLGVLYWKGWAGSTTSNCMSAWSTPMLANSLYVLALSTMPRAAATVPPRPEKPWRSRLADPPGLGHSEMTGISFCPQQGLQAQHGILSSLYGVWGSAQL